MWQKFYEYSTQKQKLCEGSIVLRPRPKCLTITVLKHEITSKLLGRVCAQVLLSPDIMTHRGWTVSVVLKTQVCAKDVLELCESLAYK